MQRMAIRISMVCPCDCVPDWELQLAAPAWHHGRVCVSFHWPVKRLKFKTGGLVSTECVSLSHHRKVEKS